MCYKITQFLNSLKIETYISYMIKIDYFCNENNYKKRKKSAHLIIV